MSREPFSFYDKHLNSANILNIRYKSSLMLKNVTLKTSEQDMICVNCNYFAVWNMHNMHTHM